MTATALIHRTATVPSSAAAITKIPLAAAAAAVTTTAVADATNAAAAVFADACAVCSAAADKFPSRTHL